MLATEPSAYKRLQSTRETIALTLRQKGVGERLYADTSSGSGIFQGQQSMGQAQQQYIAAGRGWAYAAIRPVAVGVATQPVRVGVQRTGRKATEQAIMRTKALLLKAPEQFKALAEKIDIQTTHPIIDLIENPNPFMVEWALKYCTAFSLEATGKAYWWIVRDEAAPTKYSLYYVPTTWVKPVIGKASKVQIGWNIGPPEDIEGTDVPMDSVIPFRYPDASDPRLAFSPLQSQAPAVNTDDEIQTAQYRAMKNGIFPGMVIRAGKLRGPNQEGYLPELSSEQRRQLISSIQGAMQGVMHFNDPIILDNMMEDVYPYTRAPAEMAFMEGSKLTKERIMMGIGTNPIVAGQIEDANRASSFVAHEGFYRLKVNPLLTLIAETSTKYLARLFNAGQRIYMWFEEAQARDEDLHLRQLQAAATFGVIEGNEFREAIGLAPHPAWNKLIPARQAAMQGVGRPTST